MMGRRQRTDPTANMHRDLWLALRRVADGQPTGSAEMRNALMKRGLLEWVPGASGTQLTEAGERAMREWSMSRYEERAVASGLSEIEARVLNAVAKLNDNASCATVGSMVWPRAMGSSSCPHARAAGAVMARLRQKGLVRRTSDRTAIRYERTRLARAFEV